MLIALIDADIMTYAIPFSLQEGKGEEAKLADEAEKFLGIRIDQFIDNIMKETQADDYKVYINGKDNFRLRYPTYKANRSSMQKPLLHYAARDYLVDKHCAHIVDCMETDDRLAIDQTEALENDFGYETVICSIDKDLLQVPGKHYRWPISHAKEPKPEHLLVSVNQGLVSLYKQALTGDTVDNIIGLKGYGAKKAEKLITEEMSEKEMYETCLEHYLLKERTEQDLIDNMHQLYMLRSEDDEWKRPN